MTLYFLYVYHVSDLLGPEFLGLWWKAHEGIDRAVREELHRLGRGVHDPVDVLRWIQTDLSHHTGEKDMRR